MPTAYRPKHKRTAFAGTTPRGPERWARAYDNALRRPTSHGAKLLFKRIVNARKLVDQLGAELEGPFEYVRPEDWRDDTKLERQYATCSLHCAAMNAQLEWHIEDSYIKLLQLFLDERLVVTRYYGERSYESFVGHGIRQLDPKTLTRTVRCQGCGRDIKPQRSKA